MPIPQECFDSRNLAAATRDSHCTFLALCGDDFKRVVLARVARVEDHPVDGPDLNLMGLSGHLLLEHTSPSDGSDGGAFRRERFALAWRTEPLTAILRPNHSSRRCFCGRCVGRLNVADPYRAYRAFRAARARGRAKPLGCGFSRSVRKIHCVSRIKRLFPLSIALCARLRPRQ